MFDHRAICCSIRVINSRCDILLDRSVVTHGFSRCSHKKLQYKVFWLLFTHRSLVVSRLYRSDDSISHSGLTCQVSFLGYVLLYAVCVFFKFAIETSRQRRGSKIRSSLQRAEMIYYVTLSSRGSWIQSRHSGTGSKLIGHLRLLQFGAHVHTRNNVLDCSTLQTVALTFAMNR